MTDQLVLLHKTAKRLARATRIPLHQALDIVATQCGHPHWNELTKHWKKGWRPTEEQLASLPQDNTSPRHTLHTDPTDMAKTQRIKDQSGTIDGRPYDMTSDIMGVCIGEVYWWSMYVDAAPSIPPKIETYNASPDNPIFNEAFRAKVLKIATEEADRVREQIASDWPRGSMRPGKDGIAVHPLFSNFRSATWYCLHCDGSFESRQMAKNMWHCPTCSATPIDIFPTPFWKGNAA